MSDRVTVAPGRVTALIASLMDHFKLKPWEIAHLTWRQIAEYYFHDRDENGDIRIPEPPAEIPEGGYTFEQVFAGLQQAAPMMPLADYKRLMVELCTKHNRPLPEWWDNLPKTEGEPAPRPRPQEERPRPAPTGRPPKRTGPINRKKPRGPGT